MYRTVLVPGHKPESCSRRNRKLFQQKWPRRPVQGILADNQPLSVNQLNTMTTVTILPIDYDEVERPAPWRGLVGVAEEASTDDTTIEKCMYEVLDNNEERPNGNFHGIA